MELTDDDIAEFIDAWRAEFDEEISPGDARIRAGQVLELFLLLHSPLPGEEQPQTSESPPHASP